MAGQITLRMHRDAVTFRKSTDWVELISYHGRVWVLYGDWCLVFAEIFLIEAARRAVRTYGQHGGASFGLAEVKFRYVAASPCKGASWIRVGIAPRPGQTCKAVSHRVHSVRV